jgi:hypothetical protein
MIIWRLSQGKARVGRIDDPKGIPIVRRLDRKRVRGLARIGAGLVLVGASVAAGCGGSAEGTAKVTPEERKQILPHAGEGSKKGKNPATPGKSFSIKDRNKAPASP